MKPHTPGTAPCLIVFVLLMVLLFATFGFSQLQLGDWNPALSILISCTKTVLILAFYMNLCRSVPLTRLVAGAGLLWLFIMFGLSATDYLTRDSSKLDRRSVPADQGKRVGY